MICLRTKKRKNKERCWQLKQKYYIQILLLRLLCKKGERMKTNQKVKWKKKNVWRWRKKWIMTQWWQSLFFIPFFRFLSYVYQDMNGNQATFINGMDLKGHSSSHFVLSISFTFCQLDKSFLIELVCMENLQITSM